MDPEQQDAPEVLETPEADAEQPEETAAEEEALTTEQIAELKAKAAKAEELEQKNKQLFERAKKAEATKPEPKEPAEGQLAPKDFLALTENKVSSEDFDEVVRVAKILNKPISEALKDKTLKSILSERADERKTAAATQTRSPRGTTSKSPDTILDNARKGNLPEGDADIAALVNAEVASMAKR